MTIKEQGQSFQAYIEERIAKEGEDNLSIDQLFDEWRLENPTPEEHAENVAAVQASLDDMATGERGRPTSEVSDEIRNKLNLPPKQ